ncbi:MAG TPA: AMP-binding protein [Xanthomonadaceae bacterium]|jgi:acyl-CoA synthetase (AMP-forming)/AMP-acid ligase II|nr:AMP-binding protein [Xanthomonadaceae bacterium]
MAEITPLTGLIRRLSGDAERPLTTSAGHAATSFDFVLRVRAWQAVFAAAPGRRCALHHEDCFEFAAALLGAWHAGKIVYLPADTLESTLQALAKQVDGFAGTLPDGLQPNPDVSSAEAIWSDLDAETVRLVLYTSGSAGDPVAIDKCLRQLDSEIATLESRFGGLIGDAHVQGTVSHQHIYGLLFRVLWPLAAQRRFATHRLVYPEQIAALVPSQAIALISSPALLKRLPESIDWSSTRAALRVVFSSGGPLPVEGRVATRRLWGQYVIEVFGSTETGGIASRSSEHGTWQALPGVECRIDETALHVRSRHLAEVDWFRTEDRAQLIGDGFELLGRSDRLVKLEERRISLDAIERGLRADTLIDAVRVLMLAGAREKIAAVIVLSKAGQALLSSAGRKELIDHLRRVLRPQVDPIAIPKLWRFVEALPSNAQGKTTIKLLADLFRLIRPLPDWQEQSASAAKLQLAISSELAVFDGHFPNTPVLPGVALVDWAIEYGRMAFAMSMPFLRMEALKFQQLVRPDMQLQLDLGWRVETGTLSFSFRSTQGIHASGRIVFAERTAVA